MSIIVVLPFTAKKPLHHCVALRQAQDDTVELVKIVRRTVGPGGRRIHGFFWET